MTGPKPDEDPILRGLREVLEHMEGRRKLKSETVSAAEIEGYRSGTNINDAPCPYEAGTQESTDWERGRRFALERYGSH